jgi:hypothetical protein
MLLLLFIFNFGISWLNAWSVGKMWLESKATGGFNHFVTWCAAVMSACGFTWCYLFVLAFLAGSIPYNGHPLLAQKYVNGMLELGYLVIILPIIGSGIGLTINSWQNLRRDRTLGNGAIAGYNTFAQVYNTVQAIEVIPDIFSSLSGIFSSDDDDKDSIYLMVTLVIVALVAGMVTTFAIVKSSARAKAFDVSQDLTEIRNGVRVGG